MSNPNPIEERLADLKRLLKEAEKKPKENERYIEDLKVSIQHCETTKPFKVIR